MARPAGAAGIRDGRGVAVADLDADGRLDLVINNNAAPPTVLLNRAPRSASGGHWLSLLLTGGAGSNRDAVGARVRLTAGGRAQTRVVEAGSGYASQSSHELHFGLASAEWIDGLEITWPSGRVQTIDGADLDPRLALDRRLRIEEGREPEAGTVLPNRLLPNRLRPQQLAPESTSRPMRGQ